MDANPPPAEEFRARSLLLPAGPALILILTLLEGQRGPSKDQLGFFLRETLSQAAPGTEGIGHSGVGDLGPLGRFL